MLNLIFWIAVAAAVAPLIWDFAGDSLVAIVGLFVAYESALLMAAGY